MITFDNEHYLKFQEFSLNGTGYLAYRDIKKIIELYDINLNKILDLGSASGRSTNFLKTLTENVYACDVSEFAIELVKKNVTKDAFVSNLSSKEYLNSPYSSIFSFFTFLHLTSQEELNSELKRCYQSLNNNGHLLIVIPHENLFYYNYSSVECINNKPKKDGEIAALNLKKINCVVKNCYWYNETIVKLANEQLFRLAGVHMPIGNVSDSKEYFDEYNYAPYVYLIFRKNEQ